MYIEFAALAYSAQTTQLSKKAYTTPVIRAAGGGQIIGSAIIVKNVKKTA